MSNSNRFRFQKLTPIKNADINIYKDAIDFALMDDDIRNVAFTGGYGSGKSSVLLSYEQIHKEYRFIHISLAHFQNTGNEADGNSEKENISEGVLEGKVINQLIHQIPKRNIPQTDFRIKNTDKKYDVAINTLMTILLIIPFFYIVFFDKLKSIFDYSGNDYSIYSNFCNCIRANISRVVSIIICIAVGSLWIYRLIKLQKDRNILRKLNIKGNEIEVFSESKESYFDKYLHEVVYLFENCGADVIVFEDIDRFEINSIFTRLREINMLANMRKDTDNKKPLKFFYLLKDDIFLSKDRTKFFDYIIPIVPVLDSSNSYDQMLSYFDKIEMIQFDKDFLKGISLYIDDMRLLKNIYNEFIIYYKRINTIELNPNKMLALIVYKNLFPKDFNDLQMNKGFVYLLFNVKMKFIEDLKKDIETSEASEEEKMEKLRHLENASLSEIITRKNIDSIFKYSYTNELGEIEEFNDVKRSEYFDLLKYLLRYGYIDESYKDYMTYFYENSLSGNDKIFLRRVTDKKGEDWNYKLVDIKKVLSMLRITDFEQEETLNFALCDYIIQNTNSYKLQVEVLIKQIRANEKYKFAEEFFMASVNKKEFVSVFNTHWNDFFAVMKNNGVFNYMQLKEYSVISLCVTDEDTLRLMNTEEVLSKFIADSQDYMNIEKIVSDNNFDREELIQKLIEGFKFLEVSFKQMDYISADKELFNKVYETNLYDINKENIESVTKYIFGITDSADIKHRNYSIVMSDTDSPFYIRVNKDFAEYLNVIIHNCDNLITDDEQTIIDVLNRDDIHLELKKEYISCINTVFDNIGVFKDGSIWSVLISAEKIQYCEENIIAYFEKVEQIDEPLKMFINKADKELDFSDKNISISDDQKERLFDTIIPCNDINDKQYEQIISSIGTKLEYFDIAELSASKVDILVNDKIIVMNEDNLKNIRETYPNRTNQFIKKNISKYAEIMTWTLADYDEIIEILSWDVEDSIKLRLLKFIDGPISVIGKAYTTTIKKAILEEDLMQSDMDQYLYQNYSKEDKEIQTLILDNAKENIDNIISSPDIAENALIDSLISSTGVEYEKLISLFTAALHKLDEGKVKEYLLKLQLSKYVEIFDKNKRPRFECDELNKNLLCAFKNRGWIKEFKESGEGEKRFYRIKRS